MRRVIFEEKGGPEVLKFETLDLPSPATGEARYELSLLMRSWDQSCLPLFVSKQLDRPLPLMSSIRPSTTNGDTR